MDMDMLGAINSQAPAMTQSIKPSTPKQTQPQPLQKSTDEHNAIADNNDTIKNIIAKSADAVKSQEEKQRQQQNQGQGKEQKQQEQFLADVSDAVAEANKRFKSASREFEMSIHEGTKEIMVKIKDSDTKKIIREVPPEKILDIIANLRELVGLQVDEKR